MIYNTKEINKDIREELANKNVLIIWDWNGTLLNDVDACVNSMNQMLVKRDKEKISNDYYKSIFTFPVQNYYEKLEFDFTKEPFTELSIEYIDLYKKNALDSPLQSGAIELLEFLKCNNMKQIILSASEQKALESQVKERGIVKYFDALVGLDNIYAKSKMHNAKKYIEESSVLFHNKILIGDTYHDMEVAEHIGATCILVSNGHQVLKKERINGNALLVNSLNEIPHLILKLL